MTISKSNLYAEKVLNKIKTAYNIETDASLARFLGMKPNTLAMQKKRGSLNWFRILQKCSDIDKNWLLHFNSFPANQTSFLLPYIKQSRMFSGQSLLNDVSNLKKATFPSYLLPEELTNNTDQLLLIKIDDSPRQSTMNNGDVLLVHTEVDPPVENKHYLVDYKKQLLLTRMVVESGNQITLTNENVKLSHHKIQSHSNEITLIGRVHWIGNEL